ncbi:MAG: cellulase family glycosylhydrolase [Candidatus Omnitrophica bacterium]|nr:cellulase family glycosylhydrolase [Candidatus Omnitrophota bacterium]
MKVFKGVNLGGWLLMEGYILGGRNISESSFKRNFKKRYSQKELSNFERNFRRVFITEEDLKRISSWGAKVVRVPFNAKLIEKKPYTYDKGGLDLLKELAGWASKLEIYLILDLHSGCAPQNKDWHSDSEGEALLWEEREYQKRTISLWEYLADNFKEEKAIIGYDLLNEPVIEKKRINILKKFYKELVKAVKAVDKEHLLFLEGNLWAQEIGFLRDLIEDEVWPSIHFYPPLDFTFNFRPHYKYPGYIGGELWNKDTLRKILEKYYAFSRKNRVGMFVGEFGVNFRGGYFGELDWLRDCLEIFEEWGFSWTYWTYKAVANSVFPDGLIQYRENPPWVRREGPVYGWENYYDLWGKNKREIIQSLNSENFSENKEIIDILKEYFDK